MKVGIITHHSVHNHGAILQLYGLIMTLKDFNCNAKALDYKKNYDFFEEGIDNKYNISIKSVPIYIEYLKKQGIRKTVFNIKKRKILEEFKKDKQIIGEYYSHAKDLKAVFIGADEVFSIEPGLNPFFWGMGVPCKNIFSYAGSFGPTTLKYIDEKNAKEFINAGIHHLNKISVRDRNSYEIIKEIAGIEVPQFCDPVILYGYKKEKQKFVRPIKEKYIVIYAYDNNMNNRDEVERIINFARKNNFKIVSPGFYHRWCDINVNVNPIQLLEYINYAEIVITDTFHGTVTSLVMNTQFITKIRGNSNKLGFLLDEYAVKNRETKNFTDLDKIYKSQINYEEINEIINNKQTEGKLYIKSCLESINENQ